MIRIPRFIALLPAVAAFCASADAGVTSRMSSRFLARGEMAILEVALDGERELTVTPPQDLALQLRADGPWIIDSSRVMREMVRLHLLDL